VLLRQQIKISGIVCVVLVALVVWILSLGVFKGTPERHLKRYGDIHALVPWLFHQIGYDVFFDFREQHVPKLPDEYWLIESESDSMSAIQGAPLKKADLRYADFYQAVVVKANLRNAEMRVARLRESDFRNADLRDVKNLSIEDLKTVKTLYRAKMDEDVRQQLQRNNKKLFIKSSDTWFDMTTPYNVDRKDICE
jgi:hypothetical protein